MKPVSARSHALAGHRAEAGKILAELERSSRGSHRSAYQRATVQLALGQTERALDLLETACEDRDPWVLWLKVDPMLDELRGHPRFHALQRAVFAGA